MGETFLYLTTIGRKTGLPHRIEIWFVEYESRYYMVSERREASHWVQNILAQPQVSFSVGTREAPEQTRSMSAAHGRAVSSDHEPELVRNVSTLMDAKYQWSDGLIIELDPTAATPS